MAWTLLRKLKYVSVICCLIDLFLFLVKHLSSSIWTTSISGVISSWTTIRVNSSVITLLLVRRNGFGWEVSLRSTELLGYNNSGGDWKKYHCSRLSLYPMVVSEGRLFLAQKTVTVAECHFKWCHCNRSSLYAQMIITLLPVDNLLSSPWSSLAKLLWKPLY